jgi:cytochrome c oxidase cbb3-type subunit 3
MPLVAAAEHAPFDAPSIIALKNPYEGNAYAAQEGQRLYDWYNCSGCHSRGGGGMGPALMDKRWIYGGSAGQIYRTIVEGTPKGMPAWGTRLGNDEIWKLVTYVQSLSADKRLPKPPGPRMDRLQAGEGTVSR